MKIFIVSSWYPTKISPGDGSFFIDRAKFIQEAGHDVYVISNIVHSLKKFFDYDLIFQSNDDFVINHGLKTYRRESIKFLPFMTRLFFNDYKKKLCLLVKNAINQSGKPDYILINSSIWAGAAISELLHQEKIPFIVSEHLKEFLIPNGFSNFQLNCIYNCYKNASHIIATSFKLKNTIEKKMPDFLNKIALVPNPTDFHNIKIVKKTTKFIETFKFISVTSFRSEKRVDLLLYALHEIIRENNNIQLTIIGDGPEKNFILKLIQKLNLENYVILKGYLCRKKIIKELIDSHAFVLSSDIETFGVVLIEALSCGLPIIATRCGGPEDIVNNDNGILVDKGNSKALTVAMKKMIQKIGYFDPIKLQLYIKNNFSQSNYIKKINFLINTISIILI